MEKYLILIKKFDNLNEAAYEVIIDQLYDLGVEGVEIKTPWTQKELDEVNGDYFDIENNADETIINAYITEETFLINKASIDRLIGDYEISGVEEESKWLLAYQKYFNIMKPGKRFVIVPAWMEYEPKENELIIKIDPSIAFGTGSHPTTKNVLLLMEEMDFIGKKVVDVGAGSGILSYGASLLGAKDILVIDNDLDAIKVSKENLTHIECIEYKINDLLDGIDNKFDIIIANIVADVIVLLSDYLEVNLSSGGVFLVSGIIENKWPIVFQKILSKGLVLEKMIKEQDWVTAKFIKE
ncbi:MAG: ribosomal protein L11 methyltransferase [Fusobacteria bacterium]|nr:MAG: ribosomal protein L11 methyltransferase [Fusobacteriota bacterium]KAF0229730.1 MAG: ribosomal protein L11 [Fusobacteriota bacterium]